MTFAIRNNSYISRIHSLWHKGQQNNVKVGERSESRAGRKEVKVKAREVNKNEKAGRGKKRRE